MASRDPVRFAELVTSAIHSIKRREGKPVRVIQDELGHALGKDGGSMIEFWRKGNVPARQRDLEALAMLLAERSKSERRWMEDLLTAAGYGAGIAAFCNAHYGLRGNSPNESRESSAFPIYQAPAVTPYYVRRAEETTVRKSLTTHRCSVVGLVGMGGAGKSTLAAHVAQSLRYDFPDGVLWVHAANAEPLDMLQHWARLFGYDFRHISDLGNRAAAVRGIWPGKRVLIVLDDVRTPGRIRPLLPGESQCAVILTTRDRDIVHLVDAEVVDVDALDRSGTLTLLQAIIGADRLTRERDEVQYIANTVGDLPLAVEIVGRLLQRSQGKSLASMAKQLADASQRLDRLILKDLSVRAAFEVSWAVLPSTLRPFFLALGLFHARSCSYLALAAIVDASVEETFDAIANLTALSLVYVEDDRRLHQHPLLADFARERTENESDLRSRYIDYFVTFAETHKSETSVIDEETENLAQAIENAHVCERHGDVVALVFALQPTWLNLAQYGMARRYGALAIDAARQLGDQRLQAQALLFVGYACQEQSDFPEAALHFQECLRIARTDDQRRLAADAQLYLARIAIEQSDLEAADELLDESFRICEALGDDKGIAQALREQGLIAYRQGAHTVTASLCHQALVIQERLKDYPGILGSLRLLADVALDKGDLAEALEYGNRSLDIAKSSGLTSELAETHFVLAATHRLQRNADLASHHAEAALALFTRIGNRSYVAYTLAEQSMILTLSGLLGEAQVLAQQAYAMQLGLGDKYGQATTLLQLGDLFELNGEMSEASKVWHDGWMLAKEIHYPHIQAYEQRLKFEDRE